jgi:hypothetical protein
MRDGKLTIFVNPAQYALHNIFEAFDKNRQVPVSPDTHLCSYWATAEK